MAITNHERVGKALDLLKEGLRPFVEREMKAQYREQWMSAARASAGDALAAQFRGAEPQWDSASLLAVMWNQWNDVFRKTLARRNVRW